MLPLHHGAVGDGDQNWLERFNDSNTGVLLSSTLHSAGALLFAAGLALYLYVAHVLRRSQKEETQPPLALLTYAHGFTLAGILLNGLGGIARLKQSDHPGLERLRDSTWVQVLLVKHLFLVAGVGLALFLTWRVWTLTRGIPNLPKLQRESPRFIGFAVASFLTILIATLLGAVASNVDLDADLGRAPAASTPATDHETHSMGPLVLAESVDPGEITGLPAAPGSKLHEFTMPEGADTLVAVLTWTHAVAQLDLLLKDPTGGIVEGTRSPTPTTLTVMIEAPSLALGQWDVTVVSQQAAAEPYELRLTALRSTGLGNYLEKTVNISPGRFYEANLLMGTGANFSYAWELVGTNAKIHFDIHLHPDPLTVNYAVNGDYNELSGNYTHTTSEPGPSLLWENTQSASVTVHLRLWGNFAVDSFGG